MKTLRFKLTASFLLVIVIVFALIGIIINVILEKQFKQYVIDNLNAKNEEIVSTLENRYSAWGEKWDVSGIENIGMSALSDGLIIRVSNSENTVIWDAMTHNSGMCAELLQNMAENMESRQVGFDGGYTEKAYSLKIGGKTAGTVSIGYYGPYFYTDNDLSFLHTLNQLLVLATLIGALLSFLLGTYMAKRLSGPIVRVTKTAEQIGAGDYESRVAERSDTKEIVELTETINTLAENLGNQETLRKQLTADVAHELRTPIANLQGHLEAMLDGIWTADAERLRSLHEETVRLSKIVGDLETLARYDGEDVKLEEKRFDVSALARSTAAGFESGFRQKEIELSIVGEPQFLTGDEDKIAQVLVNLLANALKHTAAGGRVTLAVDGDEREVRIAVGDTGSGIAAADLPFIFERFYRADHSRSRGTGGSGIGLSIVKSLVKAHGGAIVAHSTEGEGSEFIITLPR